jgi:CRISPR-associated protein Cas2
MSMLYVVAYDVSNDKRRTKIHKALCGFGEWTQYSLFECFLSPKEMVKLRAKLDELMEVGDSVRMYPLCNGCQTTVETFGGRTPEEKVTYIL